jgi:uncharacterized protein (TIGR01244 family)
MPGPRRALLGAAAAGLALAAVPRDAPAQPGPVQRAQPGGGTAPMPGLAPTGDMVSEQRIPLYHRGTPLVALAGPLTEAGVREAKRLGFNAIIDLRPDPARAAEERRNAEFARIRYIHLPVAGAAPTEEEVRRFSELLADRANLPALVHGGGVDQSGAMWALYRAALGVPPEIALLDGETAGLRASRDAVRARLGLAAR